MTDNQRLARVLEILARVAAKGDPLPEKFYLAVVSIGSYLRFGEVTSLQTSELLVTEAARLAGVPVDGWYTGPGHDCFEKEVLVQHRNGKRFVATWTGAEWADESLSWRETAIAAWRPLPAPYRPEEKTDEQR